jgi:RNA polymerase sigma-70 factor, ECF subfamily
MRSDYVRFVKKWASRLHVHLPAARAQDAVLLRAIAAGDTLSMAPLYQRYRASLLRISAIALGSEAEAEDLFHEVFYEACAKAGSYDPQRSSVGTWLLMRLRSRAIDQLRSARITKRSSLGDADRAVVQPATTDSPVASYLGWVTRRNIAALPSKQQQLLRLIYCCEHSLPEVAAQLKVPLGTAKSRLARTLAHLGRIDEAGELPVGYSSASDSAARAVRVRHIKSRSKPPSRLVTSTSFTPVDSDRWERMPRP